jgi:integrase
VKFAALARAVVDHYDVNGLRSRDDIECRYRLHLFPYFGNRKAVSITGNHINAYVVHRKGEGAAAGTINRELEAMKRAFRLGMEQGTVAQMPTIKLLKESNVRTGFFTRAEVDRLVIHLREPLNRFVLFAFLTAWRYDEIRNLKWSNVDFDRGEVRLDPGSTKSGEGRTFPMTAELRGLLEPLAAAKRAIVKMPVFQMAARTFVFQVRGNQIGQFRKRWQTACKKAGLPVTLDTKGRIIKCERLFHDLRRSGVRELAKILGERRAMQRSGHKTRSVFDRYNVVSDFDLTEDRKLLDAMSTDKATSGTKFS